MRIKLRKRVAFPKWAGLFQSPEENKTTAGIEQSMAFLSEQQHWLLLAWGLLALRLKPMPLVFGFPGLQNRQEAHQQMCEIMRD